MAVVGPDDEADGNQDSDDNLLVVPGIGRPAGATWWGSAGVMGGARGGVGPGVDVVVPELGHGGGIGGGSGDNEVLWVWRGRYCLFALGVKRRKSATTPVSCNLRNEKPAVICYSMG